MILAAQWVGRYARKVGLAPMRKINQLTASRRAAKQPTLRAAGMSRQCGFALLIVLWTMALLAVLVAQFTSTGRNELRVSANLRTNAVVQAAADGAVHEAALRLLQGLWFPDGRAHVVRIGTSAVDVRVTDESWKVNPNEANLAMLQAMLASRGIDAGRTASLSKAIIDWRTGSEAPPPSAGLRRAPLQPAGLSRRPTIRQFESLDELALVPTMTPALLARITPALSLYQEGDALQAADALPPGTSQASGATDSYWHFGSTGRVMLVAVEATAIGQNGGRFARHAVVRLRAEGSLDQAPYQVLTWDVPVE
jgi:general secretion pathway protein K